MEYRVYLNHNFLEKATPAKVALYGIIIYCMIFIIAPVDVKWDLHFAGLVYIFLCYVFFIIGSLNFFKVRKCHTAITISEDRLLKIFKLAVLLGTIGIMFKIYDRFFVRNLSFLNMIFENRDLAVESSANVFAIIGSFLFLISFYPLYLVFLTGCKNIKKYFGLSIVLFFYLSVDSLLLAGRFGIIINITIFILYLSYFNKIKINIKAIVVILSIVVLLVIVISFIWHQRLLEMKMDVIWSMYNSGYAHMIPPDPAYVQLLENNSNSFFYHVIFVYGHFCQYYLHGLFEFFDLYSYVQSINSHLFGANQFSIVFKFIYKITGSSFDSSIITRHYYIPGLYTSFWGPVFVDFGWGGPLFMFFFGMFQKYIWRKIYSGRFLFMPLYFYFIMVTLFMPVINLFMGIGNYAFFSMIFFVLCTKLRFKFKLLYTGIRTVLR